MKKADNNSLMTIGNSGLTTRTKNCLSAMLCDETYAPEFFDMPPFSGWQEAKEFPLDRIAPLKDSQLLKVPNLGRKSLKEFRDLTNSHQDFLLPCPFCGGQPTIVYKDAPSNIIKCENIKCSVKPQTGNERTWSMCVSVWNRRSKG